jgi:tetratricopeptide (TPR) repeat protein
LKRLELADRALGLARSVAAPMQELWARVWRTDAFWELGDIASVDAEIERLTGLAHALRNPLPKWHLQRFQAARALLVGRYEQAATLSEKATAAFPPDNFMAQILHLWFMSAINADRGEFTWMDRYQQMMEARPSTMAATLSWSLLSAGRRDEALAYYEQARASLRGLPRAARWMPTLVFLADASSQFDDRETAEACYRELLPFADRFAASGGGTVICQGSVALFLGMSAMTLGHFEASEDHLRHAIQRNTTVGARPWAARAELVMAELLRRQGRARSQPSTWRNGRPAPRRPSECRCSEPGRKPSSTISRRQVRRCCCPGENGRLRRWSPEASPIGRSPRPYSSPSGPPKTTSSTF